MPDSDKYLQFSGWTLYRFISLRNELEWLFKREDMGVLTADEYNRLERVGEALLYLIDRAERGNQNEPA